MSDNDANAPDPDLRGQDEDEGKDLVNTLLGALSYEEILQVVKDTPGFNEADFLETLSSPEAMKDFLESLTMAASGNDDEEGQITPNDESPTAPVNEPASAAVPKPVDEPTSAAVPKAVDEPTSAVVPKPVDEPTSAAIPKPVDEATSAAVPKAVDVPTSAAVPKPVDEPTSAVVPKTVDEPTSAAVPKPVECAQIESVTKIPILVEIKTETVVPAVTKDAAVLTVHPNNSLELKSTTSVADSHPVVITSIKKENHGTQFLGPNPNDGLSRSKDRDHHKMKKKKVEPKLSSCSSEIVHKLKSKKHKKRENPDAKPKDKDLDPHKQSLDEAKAKMQKTIEKYRSKFNLKLPAVIAVDVKEMVLLKRKHHMKFRSEKLSKIEEVDKDVRLLYKRKKGYTLTKFSSTKIKNTYSKFYGRERNSNPKKKRKEDRSSKESRKRVYCASDDSDLDNDKKHKKPNIVKPENHKHKKHMNPNNVKPENHKHKKHMKPINVKPEHKKLYSVKPEHKKPYSVKPEKDMDKKHTKKERESVSRAPIMHNEKSDLKENAEIRCSKMADADATIKEEDNNRRIGMHDREGLKKLNALLQEASRTMERKKLALASTHLKCPIVRKLVEPLPPSRDISQRQLLLPPVHNNTDDLRSEESYRKQYIFPDDVRSKESYLKQYVCPDELRSKESYLKQYVCPDELRSKESYRKQYICPDKLRSNYESYRKNDIAPGDLQESFHRKHSTFSTHDIRAKFDDVRRYNCYNNMNRMSTPFRVPYPAFSVPRFGGGRGVPGQQRHYSRFKTFNYGYQGHEQQLSCNNNSTNIKPEDKPPGRATRLETYDDDNVEMIDLPSDEDEANDNAPPPIAEVQLSEAARMAMKLLDQGSIPFPEFNDNYRMSSADVIAQKCAWWFQTKDKYNVLFTSPCVPELDDNRISSDYGDGSQSSFGHVSNPDNEDEYQSNEVSSSDQRANEMRQKDADLRDEYCGATLLNAKFRTSADDNFQNIFELKPGSNYEKENLQAKCTICDELIIGKRHLTRHLRSEDHRQNFKNISLSVMTRPQNIKPNFHGEDPASTKRDSSRRPERENSSKQYDGGSNMWSPISCASIPIPAPVPTQWRSRKSRSKSPATRHQGSALDPSKSRSPLRRYSRSRSPVNRSRPTHSRSPKGSNWCPPARRRPELDDVDWAKCQMRERSPSPYRKKSHGSRSGSPAIVVTSNQAKSNLVAEKFKLQAFGLWTSALEENWVKMEKEEAALNRNMDEYRRNLAERPETVHTYKEEWAKWWGQKYMKVQERNLNPDTYDYTLEWKEFWTKHLEVIVAVELESQIEAIRSKYDMNMDKLQGLLLGRPAPVVASIPRTEVPVTAVPGPSSAGLTLVSSADPSGISASAEINEAIIYSPISPFEVEDDFTVRSMSISPGISRVGETPKVSKGPSKPVTVEASNMGSWEQMTGQKMSGASDVGSARFGMSIDMEKEVDGNAIVKVLQLMKKSEDQLGILSQQVDTFTKNAEELEAARAKASFTLLENKEFVVLLFQCRDKFNELMSANTITTRDILKRINYTVYKLNLILELDACQNIFVQLLNKRTSQESGNLFHSSDPQSFLVKHCGNLSIPRTEPFVDGTQLSRLPASAYRTVSLPLGRNPGFHIQSVPQMSRNAGQGAGHSSSSAYPQVQHPFQRR